MKAEHKINFISFFVFKAANKNSGFTLIELLVVIIVIGILSAIALPSFLQQSSKARASEARVNIGSLNRAQQAYYLENQQFAQDDATSTAIDKLGIGIKPSTTNYEYTVTTTAVNSEIINKATAKNEDLKGYAGAVFSSAGLTKTILCEADNPGIAVVNNPTSADLSAANKGCGTDSRRL